MDRLMQGRKDEIVKNDRRKKKEGERKGRKKRKFEMSEKKME